MDEHTVLYRNECIFLSDLGTSIRVHVLNLVEPVASRRIRDLDTGHVKFLEDSFLASPGGEFHLLAGLLVEGDIERVAEPGEAKIEVLGGNHSRAALSSLHRRGLHDSFCLVSIYEGLTDEEALKLGYHHNKISERAKAMSFVDIVNIIRKQRESDPNNLRKKLQRIFDYKVFIS